MLEYVDPVLLPLIDPTAPRYQWRTNISYLSLIDGAACFRDKRALPVVPPRKAKWLAVVQQRLFDRGLASDGRQYARIGSDMPIEVTREHYLPLTDFLRT